MKFNTNNTKYNNKACTIIIKMKLIQMMNMTTMNYMEPIKRMNNLFHMISITIIDKETKILINY